MHLCQVTTPAPGTSSWATIPRHQIDFHVITLDEHGRGTYGPPENGEYYPAEALTGKGTVRGRIVECITPDTDT